MASPMLKLEESMLPCIECIFFVHSAVVARGAGSEWVQPSICQSAEKAIGNSFR